jgi:beta-glucosidase
MKPFAWGIASASYQSEDPAVSEGSPEYFEVDWDVFYKAGKIKQPRGNATYSWTETARDIAAIKSLGLTHYRFGIEWARVEPKPGQFNEAALNKYVELAKELKRQGLTPVVCLWHFNFPDWLTDLDKPEAHGWFHPLMNEAWPRYVRKVLEAFGDTVTQWMPQNEPNAYAFMGYVVGWFPPGRSLAFQTFQRFMTEAARYYNQSADLIHQASPANKVITVQNIVYWKKSLLDLTGFYWRQAEAYNYLHLDLVHEKSDVIGFNYYFKLSAFLVPGPRTINPKGMAHAIETLYARYKKPLCITENGMQEPKDKLRPRYIREHVAEVLKARQSGLPVEGYYYWCLIDNFEWCQGYKEKFGLFTMDPQTRRLTPKPSAHVLREIVTQDLKGPTPRSETRPLSL